jgi:uncharacterized FlgJ-related protein
MLEFRKETLEFVKTENQYQKPFYVCLAICLFLIMSLSYSFYLLSIQSKELKQMNIVKSQIQWHNEKTMELVDNYIDQLPFADKELIKRQYRIESGNLTSYASRYENNLFGMKISSRKHTYMGVSKDNYVIYSDWTLSIIDRLLYEIYCGTSLKGYATDENYFKKLNIKK